MAGDDTQAHGSALRRWLFEDALPLWASAGVNVVTGGFGDAIGWNGAAIDGPLRARVQARQVYVYATAGRLGWPGSWRSVMQGGQDFIARSFLRPDGLYRTRIARDGTVVDETAVLYDQAFFLFAAAAAAQADPDQAGRLAADALAHLALVQARFAHPAGGYREASAERPFQSNAHMHLLEAALAWEALSQDQAWRTTADAVATLCLERFVDPQTGAVREVFDEGWWPAPGEPGRIVEPGHQFEWAWLLERWGVARGHGGARRAARRLFQIGVTHGVDPARGVAFNALDDRLAPLDAVARLWPQTERIKAAVTLAGEDREEQVAAACAGLRLYLADRPAGLWRDRMNPDGTFVAEPAPASSFYHIVCALETLFAAPAG